MYFALVKNEDRVFDHFATPPLLHSREIQIKTKSVSCYLYICTQTIQLFPALASESTKIRGILDKGVGRARFRCCVLYV